MTKGQASCARLHDSLPRLDDLCFLGLLEVSEFRLEERYVCVLAREGVHRRRRGRYDPDGSVHEWTRAARWTPHSHPRFSVPGGAL